MGKLLFARHRLPGLVVLMGALLFFTPSGALAQTSVLTGKVVDSLGRPIPGVTIQEQKGRQTVSTGPDGSFRLRVSPRTVLEITSIGYASQQVQVANQMEISVTLRSSSASLNEVVFTALGVKRDKRTLTYSTQQITGAELVQAKEPNVVNAMAGKIAGVQVTSSSGTAGASARMVIRGATSVFGDNQPLFVIDGVPVNNDQTSNIGGGAAGAGSNRIVDIDPATIESVNVLKGAAATTLYGSAGARGVVLISTKNGSMEKKLHFFISSDLSFEHPLLPKRQTSYAQGTGGEFYNGEDMKTSQSWGPRMDTLMIDGKPAKKYNPDNFFRTGVTSNTTASVDGGGPNSNYFISYSYYDQKSLMPGNDFKRHSFFAKYNTKMSGLVNTTFQLGYSHSEQNRLPEGASNGPLFVDLIQPVSWNPYPILLPDGTQRGYRLSRNMALWDLGNINNNSAVNRFLPVFTVNLTPANWLTLTERVGADIYMEQDKYIENPSPQIGLTGQVKDQDLNFRQFNNDVILSAQKAFGKFNVNLLIGNNVYSQYNSTINLNATGLTIPGYYNQAAGQTLSSTEGHYLQRKVGFYSQANIEYDQFVNLALTGRYDGSSVLSSDHNYYPYGSVAAGLIFSRFFSPRLARKFNFAKLRISYATVGNDGVGPYSLNTPYYQAVRNTNAGSFPFPYQGQPGFLLSSTLGNENLKNERLNEYEGGLEFRFLKDRLRFEGSYFSRKSVNGIIPGVSISNATGFSGTTVNTASISNKGIELLISATPVRSRDFSWDLTFNFTRIRNKILALAPGITQLGRLIVGQPYNIFYGARYSRTADGKLLIDSTGMPVVDPEQGKVGDVNPDWLAGIENSFHYKSLSFSFFFDMKKGGDVQNDVQSAAFFYGTAKITENRQDMVIKGTSQVSGKENTVAVPAQQYYQSRQYESSIQDGTYLKLRNVSLAYTLGSKLIGKSPFSSVTLAVTGRNLWIYSPHFTGADPEVSSYGNDNGSQGIYAFSTPTSRSVNFSLKLGF